MPDIALRLLFERAEWRVFLWELEYWHAIVAAEYGPCVKDELAGSVTVNESGKTTWDEDR